MEPGDHERTVAADTELATPPMRLQILSTEHWSLLASRGLAWNETFTRAGMFLSTLSFGAVALALVAQASGFGPDFRLFALVVLPVVLLIGIGTQRRLEAASNHDAQCVIGMNRIRAVYVQMAPDLRPLFVMGITDDMMGVGQTMGFPPRAAANPTILSLPGVLAGILASTPFLVGVLNSVVLAAIVGLAALQIGIPGGWSLAGAGATFVVALTGFGVYFRRSLAAVVEGHAPLFPAENSEDQS